MKTNTAIYDKGPAGQPIPGKAFQAEPAGPACDDIVAKACPERIGTVRRIHRLWKGPLGTCYRVNWHEDDGWMDGERRIVRSAFVTVKDGLAVVS